MLQNGLNEIRGYIENLNPFCNLSTIRPDMSAAQLSNLKFPELKVKKWDGGPGFFRGVKHLQEFMTKHPCQGDIYVTRILDQFHDKEREVYDFVKLGNQPTSVPGMILKVALRFVKPADEEVILLDALRVNERLVDPSSAKTILTIINREIPKVMTFMAVIQEAKEMRSYYLSQIPYDKVDSWLHQGVFTNKFMGQLLLNICVQDYFAVSKALISLNYVDQLDHLHNYAEGKLNHFTHLRNLNAGAE